MKPTHRHKQTGTLVFPEGYRPADLEKLTAADWKEIEREAALHELRAKRNRLLLESGEFMWPDRPMADAERAAWIAYRQQLRDLPDTADPLKVKWPKAPNEGN